MLYNISKAQASKVRDSSFVSRLEVKSNSFSRTYSHVISSVSSAWLSLRSYSLTFIHPSMRQPYACFCDETWLAAIPQTFHRITLARDFPSYTPNVQHIRVFPTPSFTLVYSDPPCDGSKKGKRSYLLVLAEWRTSILWLSTRNNYVVSKTRIFASTILIKRHLYSAISINWCIKTSRLHTAGAYFLKFKNFK